MSPANLGSANHDNPEVRNRAIDSHEREVIEYAQRQMNSAIKVSRLALGFCLVLGAVVALAPSCESQPGPGQETTISSLE